ncbi:MAG: DNA polymerase III PolC-type [bacterium]|nr:DNA polymerase III PolC-type [bacterium]
MPCQWLPDFVAVDIETTGLAAQHDELLEIAGVRFVGGEAVDHFSTTLQIDHALARRTARLTGLTDSALAAGLPAAEAIRRLDAFAGDLPLVAHNVSLDREFLIRFSKGLDGVDLTDNPWWDSLELAALVFPELESLALEHVATALHLEFGTLHRADADALLAGRVFSALFEFIATYWPASLIETIRSTDLAAHHFGQLLQRLPLPERPAAAPLAPLPITPAAAPFRGDIPTGDPQRPLHLLRVDQVADALHHPTLAGHRLLYPPHLYPGQFHGPDKELRHQAEQQDIPCDSGEHCLLDPEKLELLLAGGMAVPAPLLPFERALARAWATTSTSHDFSRLSWWVLNNFPNLAATLPRLSVERSDVLAHPPVAPPADGVALLPWETALTRRVPWSATLSDTDLAAPWSVLVPVYYPLHALRAAIRIWQVTALKEECHWLSGLLRHMQGPLRDWWSAGGFALLDATQQLEAALATAGSDQQDPASVARGDEHYWPLPAPGSAQPQAVAVRDAIATIATLLGTHLPSFRTILADADLPAETQRVLAIFCRRLESLRVKADWMVAPDTSASLIVVRQQWHRDHLWWGLAAAPQLPRDVAGLIPGNQPLPLVSAFMEPADWQAVERLWQAPARPVTYTDQATAIPRGNTLHTPLPPPHMSGVPAKKTWQNWQMTILRRLMTQESGRWLLVARNPQEVVSLHHRLREPMLQAGWQPLFQRHDGTKGFLMREFGSFDKVVMVATGEILQELNRFPEPPDTIVILHVPTRPPNELVCVALQQQLGLSADAFREQVMTPLGVLDLKRALWQWSTFRAGQAAVYLLDFRQLELPSLKAMLRANFPNQELLDTRPAVQY